jgi:Domain of unknown function (DUF4760)
MTLTEFSRDVVPVLQLLVTTLALGSLLLLWWQIKQTVLWNKLQAHHTFFRDIPSRHLERQLYRAADRIGVDVDEPLSPAAVEKFLDDDGALFALRAYLDEYEELCTAINVGTVDEDLAFAIDSARVEKTYRIFEAFIRELRKVADDDEIHLELEKVALRWNRREVERRRKRQEEVQGQGAQGRYGTGLPRR